MTLTRLLEINMRLIKYEEDRGLRLAEEVWRVRGAPSSGKALADAIETCLQRCTEGGIPYPAILLRRKKEIERGTWVPSKKMYISKGDDLPRDGDANCKKCGGSGHVSIENGLHAKMCECNKWLRPQKV
jgi:hypothetical protein